MSAEIVELGAHPNMTPEEALSLTLREKPTEVIILFYDGEGEFGYRSSGMSNKDALWLLEHGKSAVLFPEEDG